MKIFFFVLSILLARSAYAEFRLFDPGNRAPHFAELVNSINRIIHVPATVGILVKQCGFENAFYAPNDKAIILCTEIIDKSWARMQSAKGAIEHGIVKERTVFENALGEQMFVLLHEMGHAIISINQVPVFGREEDAADMFAATIILSSNQMNAYLGALNSFSSKPRSLHFVGQDEMNNEHGLPAQRKSNLACWGYGSQPGAMGTVVSHLRIDPQRLSRCPGEYQKMRIDFEKLFKPSVRP